jgi:hypothetical protein
MLWMCVHVRVGSVFNESVRGAGHYLFVYVVTRKIIARLGLVRLFSSRLLHVKPPFAPSAAFQRSRWGNPRMGHGRLGTVPCFLYVHDYLQSVHKSLHNSQEHSQESQRSIIRSLRREYNKRHKCLFVYTSVAQCYGCMWKLPVSQVYALDWQYGWGTVTGYWSPMPCNSYTPHYDKFQNAELPSRMFGKVQAVSQLVMAAISICLLLIHIYLGLVTRYC